MTEYNRTITQSVILIQNIGKTLILDRPFSDSITLESQINRLIEEEKSQSISFSISMFRTIDGLISNSLSFVSSPENSLYKYIDQNLSINHSFPRNIVVNRNQETDLEIEQNVDGYVPKICDESFVPYPPLEKQDYVTLIFTYLDPC